MKVDSAARPTTRRLVVGLSILALLASALVWWPFSSDRKRGRPVQSSSSVATATSPKDLQSWQRAFPVFQTPPEPLPKLVRQPLIREPIYGLNWKLAQHLPTGIPQQVWAVPGNHFICLISLQRDRWHRPSGGAVCSPTRKAHSVGVQVTFLNEPDTGATSRSRTIVGVAPRQTHAVVVHTLGSDTRIPVEAGVFLVNDTVANPPDRVTLLKTRRSK